jgi:hypothetical protein
VSRLAEEFRAGRLEANRYGDALEDVAREAKDGSVTQIAALGRLRVAREIAAREAEKAAGREGVAAGHAADETEKAAKREITAIRQVSKVSNQTQLPLLARVAVNKPLPGAGLPPFSPVPAVPASLFSGPGMPTALMTRSAAALSPSRAWKRRLSRER